ncbi:MAG: sodium:solute symporter family protein [Spirochaetes bacterium]|nr:sodium:solute symporter family protein [Spirochaetota bacterium]
MIIVGLYSLFKIRSSNDFYIAGKKGNILYISGSLLATILGSSAILGTVNLSVKMGWASSWMILSGALGLFALFAIAKYVRRFGKYTLPELLEDFYGKEAGTVASIIIPVAWIGIIAAQVIGASKIMTSFFDLSYQQGVLLCGSIFILYTVLGGQVSIIKTDMVQSLFILAGISLTFIFAVKSMQISIIKVSQLSFPFNVSFRPLDLVILLITYSTTFFVGPDIYSRLFCAKDEKTARQSVLLTAIILIPFAFIISFIGNYAAKYFPGMDPATGSALVHTIKAILPPWGSALMIAALLSAVMSSADTTLLTASSILSELTFKELKKSSSINITRGFIIILGILSMIFALKVTSIINSLLVALTIFSGAFVIPTAAGLLGYRTGRRQSITAIIAGGALALTGKILVMTGNKDTGNIIIICAFALNAALLFFPVKRRK